jgi:hypothetical protein
MSKDLNFIAQRIPEGFESFSSITPEFSTFARQFKAALKVEFASCNAELVKFNKGHFYCSGEFKFNGRLGYFSISDVRHNIQSSKIMYRFSDSENIKNNRNHWVTIENGIGSRMIKLLER